MAEDAGTAAATTDTATTADTGGGNGGDRSFTQAELDKIVQDRLARQRAQFGDIDELRAKAAKFDEVEQASKSELQKAQERAEKAERERDHAANMAKESTLRAALVAEASRKQVVDPDAVVALIDRSTIEFDKDGNPSNTADAVELLLKAKPYLAGGGGRANGADQGARGGGVAEQDMNALLRQAAGRA